MIKINPFRYYLFLFSFAFLLSTVSAQNLTVREIMAEPSIAGMRAEGEKLSPDGAKVIYLWNAEGKMPRDLYLVSTSGGAATKILSPRDLPVPSRTPVPEIRLNYGLELRDEFVKARENQLGNFEWSPDSKKLVFSYGGDIYILTLGEKQPKRYTKTQSGETAARFIDNNRILFFQSGNLFVLDIINATLTQISKEADTSKFVSVGNVAISKNGKLAAYVVSDASKFTNLPVPNYLGEFTAAPPVRRGWSEQKILVVPTDGSRDTPFEIKLPKAEGVNSFRRMVWAADNTSLIVDRNDKDTKRRQLYYIRDVGSKGEQTILITQETDDKWIGQPSIIVESNPKDSSQLLFSSERDGFSHLYLAKLEDLKPEPNPTGEIRGENPAGPGYSSNVKIEQFTSGKFQVEWAKWLGNGNDIMYMTTENGTATRGFMVTETKDQDNPWDSVVKTPGLADGMKTNPQMESSGESAALLYSYSRWKQPDELIFQKICYRCEGSPEETLVKLTRTTPDVFLRRTWNEPKFMDIPSRDGKLIKSKIYMPPGFDQKKKYPMVIFVHGAGYLQNVINGWNNYYREFMFNQILTQKGYVVLDIDYRGSAGYGRDWRTDVYDFLGGKDYDDHIDGIDFMVKNFAVDPAKVGVYGGSYGGFMAAMLAMRAPDKIAAAAALRPVFDWKNYYASSPGYTAQRLGFPDKNPEAYKRSSPISYADKLERPLLILHGMADDNVHVQDSVQLIEKLIRLGKTRYFETILYPSENHGFVRAESWTDEYERILAFFEKNLR